MKNRICASRYNDNVAVLLESDVFVKQQRSRRCQRRSRIGLFWVLFTLLMMLVLVAAFCTSDQTSSNTDWTIIDKTRSLKRHERLSPSHRFGYRKSHGLEISVWDYDDIQEYYHRDEGTKQQHGDNAGKLHHTIVWSEEQIEEMKRYYKRYLEVFLKTHGDMYEPEDKEVVYTEYLSYRERKAKEKAEKEHATRQRVIKSESSQKEITKRPKERQESKNTATAITVNFDVVSRLSKTSRSTIDHDPFHLEMDRTNSNKVGVGSFRRSNNATEKTDVVIIVSSTQQVGDVTSTIYQEGSGLGKAVNT